MLTGHLHLFVQSIFYRDMRNPSIGNIVKIGVEGEAANNMLERYSFRCQGTNAEK